MVEGPVRVVAEFFFCGGCFFLCVMGFSSMWILLCFYCTFSLYDSAKDLKHHIERLVGCCHHFCLAFPSLFTIFSLYLHIYPFYELGAIIF